MKKSFDEFEDDVCQTCGGEGVVPCDESDGEGHTMKGVGEEPCPDCCGGDDE